MWNKVFVFLKEKLKIIIIGFMVIALFLGYFIGRINSSRGRVIAKLETSLKEGNLRDLSKVVTIDDKKVSKEKLMPLMEYYRENSIAVDNVVRQLKNGEETAAFTVKNKKKFYGDTYNVELKVYNVKVDSNFQESKFTIDDKNFINAGESIENIIPGVYAINGILKSDYGDIKASKDFVLMKDENVQINFDAVKVTINSSFNDADVYINGSYTGMKADEACDIGPFRNDGSASVYIEKEFPWGILKSEEEYVTDVPMINLSINMENDIVKKDISYAADNFYRSVFTALNKEEKSYITNADEFVKDKIYSILEKKYTFLKNKYSISNIKIIDDKSEYIYEDGIYKANIIVQVDYSTEKELFGFDKNQNSKMFFTKFVYNEDEMEWRVNDVENFSL